MSKKLISRRKFIKNSILAIPVVYSTDLFNTVYNFKKDDEDKFIKEASYYKKLPYKKILCELCPRECKIDDLERGYCGVRENRGGTYYTLVHSRACSLHPDPIEKKPLYHFLPGSKSFSIATAGCNVNCKFCQNWEISQVRPEQIKNVYAPPESIVAATKKYDCKSIAYTYTEPVIFYEYMYDTASFGQKYGIKSVMISNGYISRKPMKDLINVLDAVKIDLKAFTERFYKELVKGKLKPVLDTLVLLKKENIWFEIVYLVIPNQNDGEEEIRSMCKWIKKELGENVPVHFSRYYPMYKLKNIPPTSLQTLELEKQIAESEGLNYVYIGNIRVGHPANNTYCHKCNSLIIKRMGYSVSVSNFKNGVCTNCNTPIPGVWK